VNIGIFLKDYSLLGGVEKVTSNLISLLDKGNGYSISSIITLTSSNPNYGSLHSSIDINVLFPNSKLEELDLENGHFSDKIYEIIYRKKINVLIIQLQELKLACDIISSVKLHTKVISILHNSPYSYLRLYGLNFKQLVLSPITFLRTIKFNLVHVPRFKILLKTILLNSEYFLCVSSTVSLELMNIFPEFSKKIKYVHNPLSFKPRIASYEKEKIVLFAGRLNPQKNLFYLLRLWSRVYPKNSGWKLLIIGEGNLRGKLLKYSNKLRLKNIDFIGEVSNIQDYLTKSSICILTSFYEGLPTIMLEAATYKNALIASNFDGGISDIIVNESNGFICDTESDFISKLDMLMNDANLVKVMGENAFTHLSNFEDSIILDQWNKIFKNL
jgi:glycosyltransferase involved in cell wall biosynthesis